MKKGLFLVFFGFIFSSIIFSQTVSYNMGYISYTLTPCTRARALSSIDFFMESKSFYHFNIYQFNFNDVLRDARITNGSEEDFRKIYSGFSYGEANTGYFRVNCIMYCNSQTGQYALLQFADFDLGGGVVHQNLRRIFERSISQVDTK